MKYSMLASGSKGNCCLVESHGVRIMIDCGTTKRYLKQSFESLELTFDDVDCVLITHDHSDHTSQLKHFSHHQIYCPSEVVFNHTKVEPYIPFHVGPFIITAVKTSHDADDSVGYIVDDGSRKLVYITDTGYIREQDFELIRDADYYILESNHDPELLMQTNRPYAIKRRILSDTGHLSNEEAGVLLSKVVSEKTKEILLAHLSSEANDEYLALSTVRELVDNEGIEFNVAKQFEIVIGGYQI
ncbi:MBL fold metallo-hydrolase [Erysipelothrix enhydrae]|uniref:MBL fold metallo-hydrolase n=1 Tax=Erysipelothrix enhydrae TaxID=2890314 RepID=UPI002B2542E5|nr:MBL fold metallo-hydrolase [Erysipelothrix sp. 4322-04]WRB87497.1 MBL fold metallo-hydrolase [Erysipelothrix sp. 4322-04]